MQAVRRAAVSARRELRGLLGQCLEHAERRGVPGEPARARLQCALGQATAQDVVTDQTRQGTGARSATSSTKSPDSPSTTTASAWPAIAVATAGSAAGGGLGQRHAPPLALRAARHHPGVAIAQGTSSSWRTRPGRSTQSVAPSSSRKDSSARAFVALAHDHRPQVGLLRPSTVGRALQEGRRSASPAPGGRRPPPGAPASDWPPGPESGLSMPGGAHGDPLRAPGRSMSTISGTRQFREGDHPGCGR